MEGAAPPATSTSFQLSNTCPPTDASVDQLAPSTLPSNTPYRMTEVVWNLG